MALFQPPPSPFAGQTTQPVLPRVPWGQNPMVTTAAFGLLGGRNLNEGLANVAQSAPAGMLAKSGMQQFMLAKQEKDAEKAAAEARKQQLNEVMKAWPGLSPEQRALFSAQPELFGQYAVGTMTPPKPTDDISEYNYAKTQGFGGTFEDWQISQKKAGATTVDARQMGTIPPGYRANYDEKGNVTSLAPLAGGPADSLPIAQASADRLISTIDSVLTDPYLPAMTGPVSGILPNVSGAANRAQSKIDQIMGGTFLQAYNDLRGGGQITEKEGEKATAAYNRLATLTMSDSDYVDALKEFRAEVVKLLEIAKTKANGGAAAPTAPMSAEEFMSAP